LSSLHKNQTLAAGEPVRAERRLRGPAPRTAAGAEGGGEVAAAPPIDLRRQFLKWYAAAGAVGLTVATLIGLYMSLQYRRDRLLMLGLLCAGVALPLVLMIG
jgi:hypothetical protein